MDRIGVHNALAADDSVVALLYAIPALVAIHAPEASLNGSDLRVAKLFALVIELCDKARAALGSNIAPVEEAVDIDLFNAALLCHIEYRKDVRQVAVNAAGGHQTHDVQSLAVCLGVLHGLDVGSILEELAVLDLLRHLRQDLEHYTTGTHIGVADLGVAHLTGGQTDIKPGCGKRGIRIRRKQLVKVRLLRLCDGVAGSRSCEAVAVKNYKNCFFRHL